MITMICRTQRVRWLMLATCALLGGCGDGGGGNIGTGGTPSPTPIPSPTPSPSPSPTPSTNINFTVSGLRPGQQLTLANGADQAQVTANGAFSFAKPVAVGSAYSITIVAGPSVDSCTLDNAAGTVAVAVNVTVACGPTAIHNFSMQDGRPDVSPGTAGTVSPQIVVASDGNIYGTAETGGGLGKGTIFRMTPTGDFAVLHNFTGNVTDGSYPKGPLIEGPGGYLYGTTALGGANGSGTLFKITRSGDFTLLYSFGDRINPTGPLVQDGGHFYGTVANAIFDYQESTGRLSLIYSLSPGEHRFFESPLTLAGNGDLLTVTTSDFTTTGLRTTDARLIRVTPRGVVSVVHSFSLQEGYSFSGNLLLDNDGNIYGVASGSEQPTSRAGDIFKVSSSGVFSILHQFAGTEGAYPVGLTWGTDGSMYGATNTGLLQSNVRGTIFRITKEGVFTYLYTFDGGAAGAYPGSALVLGRSAVPLSDPLDIFYGTTDRGGTNNLGTIFKY